MEMEPWEVWIRSTELHAFVQHYEPRLWPLLQTLHLFGFTLLIGTVGFFDLRALGVAKGIPLAQTGGIENVPKHLDALLHSVPAAANVLCDFVDGHP